MQHKIAERPKSRNLANIKPILAYIKPYRYTLALAMIFLIITAAITLSLGQGLRLMIDQGFNPGMADSLLFYVLVFVALSFILAVSTFLRHYLLSWLGERVIADIRQAVFAHIIYLHPGFFELNQSAEIQSRITTDTAILQTIIRSSISMAMRNGFMLIGGIIWLFITNVKLASVILVAAFLIIAPVIFFGRRVRNLSRASQDKIATLGSYVNEMLFNIKTLQGYNHQNYDIKAFNNHAEIAFRVAIKRILYQSALMAVVIFFILLAVAIMLWIGGLDVIDKRITAGELSAFIFYAFIITTSIGAISGIIGDLQRAAGATERITELLLAESLIKDAQQRKSKQRNIFGEITFQRLGFYYSTRPQNPALIDIDLHIPAGTALALVGPSGAGKSTLFDLLMRFYDPTSGCIKLDGTDIRQMPLFKLRQNIAVVSQQPTIFIGNLWTNIAYGRPNASYQDIEKAAEAAYVHEFAHSLPQGYDSPLGEAGIRLSGGQRQRVAIARAILCDPKILLLDEATSSLDAESENMVQKALQKLMHNRTTIVIAHRLATVREVDQIVVLNKGRIEAIGDHAYLMQHNPLYKRLAELQFNTHIAKTLDA